MGTYKEIYEILTESMKQLKLVAERHKMSTEDRIQFFQDMKTNINEDIDAHILLLASNPTANSKLDILEMDLKSFDWTYEHSDDHRYWVSGNYNQKRIQKFIDELSYQEMAKAQELVDKYRPYGGIVFNIPIPEDIENA